MPAHHSSEYYNQRIRNGTLFPNSLEQINNSILVDLFKNYSIKPIEAVCSENSHQSKTNDSQTRKQMILF